MNDFDDIVKGAKSGVASNDGPEEDALLKQEASLYKRAKIQMEKRFIRVLYFGLACFFIFAVISLIAILGAGVLNFILAKDIRWLEDERMSEIKAFVTGGAGALGASVLADKIKGLNQDRKK